MKNQTNNKVEKKIELNTVWTKYKGEKNGTLEVFYKDIVKYFVASYRSVAMKRAVAWYKKFRKETNE